MLQLEHKRRIVQACYPKDDQEALELWHDIKPVKFGFPVTWAAGAVTLATYQIPMNSRLLILRVECYTTTLVAAAPGFGQLSPPPVGATAFWQYIDVVTDETRVTPTVPIHLLCDVDEFVLGKGDHRIALQSTLPAPPDANARSVVTLVYGYLVGALVAGKIGDSESTYFGG